LLLSLYCIDLFSCKVASVFAINLLTYLLTKRDEAGNMLCARGPATVNGLLPRRVTA